MKPRHPTLCIPEAEKGRKTKQHLCKAESQSLWAVSRWRSLAPHLNTCHVSVAGVEDLAPTLRGGSWALPGFATGHWQPTSSPWRLPGQWQGRGERSTTVRHVDSVKFREGFPFAGAQEKSSSLPQPPGVPDPG